MPRLLKDGNTEDDLILLGLNGYLLELIERVGLRNPISVRQQAFKAIISDLESFFVKGLGKLVLNSLLNIALKDPDIKLRERALRKIISNFEILAQHGLLPELLKVIRQPTSVEMREWTLIGIVSNLNIFIGCGLSERVLDVVFATIEDCDQSIEIRTSAIQGIIYNLEAFIESGLSQLIVKEFFEIFSKNRDLEVIELLLDGLASNVKAFRKFPNLIKNIYNHFVKIIMDPMNSLELTEFALAGIISNIEEFSLAVKADTILSNLLYFASIYHRFRKQALCCIEDNSTILIGSNTLKKEFYYSVVIIFDELDDDDFEKKEALEFIISNLQNFINVLASTPANVHIQKNQAYQFLYILVLDGSVDIELRKGALSGIISNINRFEYSKILLGQVYDDLIKLIHSEEVVFALRTQALDGVILHLKLFNRSDFGSKVVLLFEKMIDHASFRAPLLRGMIPNLEVFLSSKKLVNIVYEHLKDIIDSQHSNLHAKQRALTHITDNMNIFFAQNISRNEIYTKFTSIIYSTEFDLNLRKQALESVIKNVPIFIMRGAVKVDYINHDLINIGMLYSELTGQAELGLRIHASTFSRSKIIRKEQQYLDDLSRSGTVFYAIYQPAQELADIEPASHNNDLWLGFIKALMNDGKSWDQIASVLSAIKPLIKDESDIQEFFAHAIEEYKSGGIERVLELVEAIKLSKEASDENSIFAGLSIENLFQYLSIMLADLLEQNTNYYPFYPGGGGDPDHSGGIGLLSIPSGDDHMVAGNMTESNYTVAITH